MKSPLTSRSVALVLALCLPFGAHPNSKGEQTPRAQVASADEEKPEPKFIWGVLINVALSKVGSLLMDWATNKLTNSLTLGFSSLLQKSAAVGFEPELPSVSEKTLWDMENIVLGEPPASLKIEDGKENFQGLVVSLAVFDSSGKPIEFRPVNANFKSGEKFKLRVLSTFDGQMSILAQSPTGKRGKLFPPEGQAVQVPKGQEILIPAQADLFFQFAGQKGEERLLIAMRGSQSGQAQSTSPVYRKDDKIGSFFVQESLQQSPLIVQTLKLKHE